MDLPYVLFVESQGQILRNLPAGFSRSGNEWQRLYVKTPEAALDIISQRSVCVVVANFGTELNKHKRFFQNVISQTGFTIQFVLLLDNIDDELVESLDGVYQCISAQCEATDIIMEIKRGLLIWEQTQKHSPLANLLLKLNKLPTPPAIYFDLRDELESINCSMETVANIISRDQAITVKLLKIVNSGFYAVPRSIVELKHALSLLGTELVLGIVLTVYLFDSLPLPGLNLDKLWKHNLIVSALAKHIAKEQGGNQETINVSGIAGLLHDLGGLILLANLSAQYHPIVRQAEGDEKILLRLEQEQFGVAHPEIGALALRLCNLSDTIIEAVELHHQHPAEAGSLPVRAVALAEWLVNAYTVHGGDFYNSFDEQDWGNDVVDQLEGWWEKCGQIAETIHS